MRTGRVVYTVTDEGVLVVGQTSSFDQSGLHLQPTKNGDTIFCEVGKAHKINYQLGTLIKSIGIEAPPNVVGDPVYVRTEGKLGQIAAVSDKTLIVAFTKDLQKRVKVEDVVNLKNADLGSVVQANVGIELGQESVHAPHSSHTLSQSLGGFAQDEEDYEDEDEEEGYEEKEEEDE